MVTIAMAMSACSSSTNENTSSASSADSPLAISVSSGALSPAFSLDVHTYELTSFTTLQDVTLTVQGRTGHVLGQTTTDGVPYTLPKLPIATGSTLSIGVDPGPNGEPADTYTINLAPASLPTFTFTAASPEPGKILLTPFPFLGTTPDPYLMIVSTAGDVLYYLHKPNGELSTDLKRQTLPDGTQYMTYLSAGLAHLLDTNMNPIRDYSILATAKHPADKADNHDIHVLGPDHVIIEGTVKEIVNNVPTELGGNGTSYVYASVIQEIENGSVVFDWQTTDFPELYGLSTEMNDFSSTTYQDYSHLNSVVVDPSNNNIMASFRHLDCLLEINRTDGSIIWRLGNTNDTFNTTAEQKTSHQHFASFLSDGRVMVYDNGVVNQATRILTFGLDTTNMKVASFEEMPLDGYFSEYMGSTQPVATNSLLVGLGTSRVGEPDVLMFDRTSGARTFSLTLGVDDYYSYRAQWEDGL